MRAMIELEAFILTVIFVAFILLLTIIGVAVWLVKAVTKRITQEKKAKYEREKVSSLEHRNRQND
jgi:Na+-transporting methylmalonyl-CoA/oxaloacetate decarboxylase gamma subunit